MHAIGRFDSVGSAPRDRRITRSPVYFLLACLSALYAGRERQGRELKFVRGTLVFFFLFRESGESVTQRAVHRRNRVTTSALIAVQRKYLFTGCLLRFVSYFFFLFLPFFPLFDQLAYNIVDLCKEKERKRGGN